MCLASLNLAQVLESMLQANKVRAQQTLTLGHLTFGAGIAGVAFASCYEQLMVLRHSLFIRPSQGACKGHIPQYY